VQLQQDDLWVDWVNEAFNKLDLNGDGFLSLNEIMDRLPLMTTDPDDDVESERLLEARPQKYTMLLLSWLLQLSRTG